MSILLNTFSKGAIKEYPCKQCKSILMESGCFRFPGMKEIRMVGSWRKENYHVRTLTHPMDALLPESKRRIICIDVFCKCDKCGMDNQFIVATTLDDKKKIRVQYNALSQGNGKLCT